MSDWEGEHGRQYRAEHKRTHYEGLTLQFRKNDPEGVTRSKVQEVAATCGMTAGQWIMQLVREELKKQQG